MQTPPPHRWEANDIINMAIVALLGLVSMSIVLMYAVLLFTGRIVPDITQTMFGTLLTGMTSGLVGFIARGVRVQQPGTPSPQVNMGDDSTTNVAQVVDPNRPLPPPDSITLPNAGAKL